MKKLSRRECETPEKKRKLRGYGIIRRRSINRSKNTEESGKRVKEVGNTVIPR